ncbi:hypothetical protein D3C76_1344340 [compost metagenome]
MAMRITFNGWLSSWARPVAISPRVAIFALCVSCCCERRTSVLSRPTAWTSSKRPCSSNTPRSDQTHQACSRPGSCRLISAVLTGNSGLNWFSRRVNASRCSPDIQLPRFTPGNCSGANSR